MSSALTGKRTQTTHAGYYYKNVFTFVTFVTCFHHRSYAVPFPTCRFGPGVDEGSGAAAAHLLIAGVDVKAVDREGPQVGDV